MSRAFGVAALGLLLASEAVYAQARGPASDDAEAFIARVTAAAARFESRDHAIREGYRRLGPDFPGMGEHWVLPSQIVAGTLDADRPPVLSYAEIDGEPRLLGVAFTLPLGRDDTPPAAPFGREVWHDHAGSVDEETLLLNHPASDHGASGARMAMVHVWTHVDNPDGVLAQNNWRLPFLRAGVAPPEHPSLDAARGVSLADDGRRYYPLLIRRAAELDTRESAAVDSLVDLHASRMESELDAARAGRGAAPGPRAAAAWTSFWRDVRNAVRGETWMRLEPLAVGTPPHGKEAHAAAPGLPPAGRAEHPSNRFDPPVSSAPSRHELPDPTCPP